MLWRFKLVLTTIKQGDQPKISHLTIAPIPFRLKLSEETKEAIQIARRRAGRFILATNVVDENILGDDEVLKEYKGQLLPITVC